MNNTDENFESSGGIKPEEFILPGLWLLFVFGLIFYTYVINPLDKSPYEQLKMRKETAVKLQSEREARRLEKKSILETAKGATLLKEFNASMNEANFPAKYTSVEVLSKERIDNKTIYKLSLVASHPIYAISKGFAFNKWNLASGNSFTGMPAWRTVRLIAKANEKKAVTYTAYTDGRWRMDYEMEDDLILITPEQLTQKRELLFVEDSNVVTEWAELMNKIGLLDPKSRAKRLSLLKKFSVKFKGKLLTLLPEELGGESKAVVSDADMLLKLNRILPAAGFPARYTSIDIISKNIIEDEIIYRLRMTASHPIYAISKGKAFTSWKTHGNKKVKGIPAWHWVECFAQANESKEAVYKEKAQGGWSFEYTEEANVILLLPELLPNRTELLILSGSDAEREWTSLMGEIAMLNKSQQRQVLAALKIAASKCNGTVLTQLPPEIKECGKTIGFLY